MGHIVESELSAQTLLVCLLHCFPSPSGLLFADQIAQLADKQCIPGDIQFDIITETVQIAPKKSPESPQVIYLNLLNMHLRKGAIFFKNERGLKFQIYNRKTAHI